LGTIHDAFSFEPISILASPWHHGEGKGKGGYFLCGRASSKRAVSQMFNIIIIMIMMGEVRNDLLGFGIWYWWGRGLVQGKDENDNEND
jgi:hypothetical protein